MIAADKTKAAPGTRGGYDLPCQLPGAYSRLSVTSIFANGVSGKICS